MGNLEINLLFAITHGTSIKVAIINSKGLRNPAFKILEFHECTLMVLTVQDK